MNQGRAKPSPEPPIDAARRRSSRFPTETYPCQPRRRERERTWLGGEGQALPRTPGLPRRGGSPMAASSCQAAAGEAEQQDLGRAWPSPGLPRRGGFRTEPSSCQATAGEGRRLTQGRAKLPPEPRGAAERSHPDGYPLSGCRGRGGPLARERAWPSPGPGLSRGGGVPTAPFPPGGGRFHLERGIAMLGERPRPSRDPRRAAVAASRRPPSWPAGGRGYAVAGGRPVNPIPGCSSSMEAPLAGQRRERSSILLGGESCTPPDCR